MRQLGTEARRTKNGVEVTRRTAETNIAVLLESGARRKPEIETGIPFLNHMLETIWWRSGLNISAKVSGPVQLQHTIAEDAGITFGRAVRAFCEAASAKGIEGAGTGRAMLDEALADVVISIEGRAGCWIDCDCPGSKAELVEGMASCNLRAFFEGFSQGAGASLRISLLKGEDPHHAWEAAFRAFGDALGRVFSKNEWRKGGIAGLKGTLE